MRLGDLRHSTSNDELDAIEAFEAAEADLALEAGFVQKARQAFPEIWPPKFVDANKWTFRDSRWRRRSCRALPDPPAPPKLRDRPPLDMLMTLQGVYEKSLGTLSPSPRRSATVDVLRAIGELDLSELD